MAEIDIKTRGVQGANKRIIYRPDTTHQFFDIFIGAVQAFATSSPGNGWLPCDGQEVSQSTYPKLYAKIGHQFGNANGGNFRLPPLNNNEYFIRGGTNIGREQLASLTALEGFDGSSIHGSRMFDKKYKNIRDWVYSEEYGDNVYLNDSVLERYNLGYYHMWIDYNRVDGSTIHRNSLNNNGGHSVVGSRPKNLTLKYFIFAGI